MSIEITEAAVAAVREAREAENLPGKTYLRVAVKGGGCSGHSYALAFETNRREEDQVVEKDGVLFLIDPSSAALLAGATLDYSSGLSGRGFVFANPNAAKTCGCGNSFAV